jgi:heme-degrading monooxygenase HmoA
MELQKPYYAVIFTNTRTDGDFGYAQMAEKMERLAQQQPGYLGFESARSGLGIAVSYWESLESIANWKANLEHLTAQDKGKSFWYSWYKVRICRVEREYEFSAE